MKDQTLYSQQKERLEELVVQIRSKDIPLEKSLDLYDEALAIGTKCVEQLEQTDFTADELEAAAEHPEVELSGAVTSSNQQEVAEAEPNDSGEADASQEMENVEATATTR